MPYNNTPITPTQEITGQVSLPLARVKKIIQTDDDIAQCSNNAAFLITVAAEMFLQHLVEQSYNIVKSERTSKPRRNIQYRDVANAVARVENLEFLSDVVPKTMTYKQYKLVKASKAASEKRSTEVDGEEEEETGPRQGTLDAHMESSRDEGVKPLAVNGESAATAMEIDDGDEDNGNGQDGGAAEEERQGEMLET